MSNIYQTISAKSLPEYNSDTLILATGVDDRVLALAAIISERPNKVNRILVLQYQGSTIRGISDLFPSAIIDSIDVTMDQINFINCIVDKHDFLSSENILIDISCIHVPEVFTLLKYFKITNIKSSLKVAYSIPFEYEFPEEPFTSYHSYYGSLRTCDLVGYGGLSDGAAHNKLILFLGFEGILSSKITEDIQYDNLLIVNNTPSFFSKYKDICVVNNYDLLASRHSKMMFVPAKNPFETYNFLCKAVEENENVCVAPLGPKTIALGVCLYALNHENIRVVYPISNEYNHHITNRVHSTRMYSIPLSEL